MKNRRKAISPVIATLIIIAVTIAISLAVAAWLMGLWGGLIGGPRISASLLKISSSSTNDTKKYEINATVLFSNTGNAPDKIVSTAAVTLRVGGSVYTATKMDGHTDSLTIDPTPPGTTKTVTFTFTVDTNLAGSTATIEIRFQSGNTIILTGTIVQEVKRTS